MGAEALRTVAAQTADIDPALEREAARFLYREARLLDEGRFEEWLDLYAEDALYWVPSRPDQEDPLNTISIFYDDKAVLRMRVNRLAHPRAYAIDPRPRTTHLVGNVEVLEDGPEGVRVRSALVMTEYRDGERRVHSGWCEHLLRREGGDFRIARKRVDLVDAGGIFQGILTVPF